MESENKNIIQKQIEAILNDSYRKELFKALHNLYSRTMLIVVKIKDNQFQYCYSEEVEQLAEKIREQIQFRENQFYQNIDSKFLSRKSK